jgi:hypothetical protein
LSAKITPPTDQNVFLAGIGHICLQWALLEMMMLGIIATAEGIPLQKTYSRYGRWDMLDRVKFAIKLAVEARWPGRLVGRLKNIQRALQKGGDGLADQRNLYVHGAHRTTDTPGEYELTMVRWPPKQRHKVVTAADAFLIANRLSQLAEEAERICDDYGAWKFKAKPKAYRGQQVAHTKAVARLVRAHNIKRAIKLLWANLKP